MDALKEKLLSKPRMVVEGMSSGVGITGQNTSGNYPGYRGDKAHSLLFR